MTAFIDHREALQANANGQLIPVQAKKFAQQRVNAAIVAVISLGFLIFTAATMFPKYTGMGVFFVVTCLIGLAASTSIFKARNQILRDGTGIQMVEGHARIERVSRAVILHIGETQIVTANNGETLKFTAGKQYRAYITEPGRILLSAETLS